MSEHQPQPDRSPADEEQLRQADAKRDPDRPDRNTGDPGDAQVDEQARRVKESEFEQAGGGH